MIFRDIRHVPAFARIEPKFKLLSNLDEESFHDVIPSRVVCASTQVV